MKVAFITKSDIFGEIKDGGTQCCKRNYFLLQKIVGAENVHACIIAPPKGYTYCSGEQATFFIHKRDKVSILKYALLRRLYFTPKGEADIDSYINSLQCDIVFFSDTRLGSLVNRIAPKTKKVVFVENIEKNYIAHMARSNPFFRVLYPAFYYNEKLSVSHADSLICLNQRDSKLMEKIYGRHSDLILPITREDTFSPPVNTNANKIIPIKELLFVGSLFHSNLEGLIWFVKTVMPHVKCHLTIIGRGFETKKKLLQRNNVDVIGTVDRLDDYYNHADAIVSPILSGDGMKVKTSEAMMYGKNIFATKEALEGYDVSYVNGIIQCNNSREFIDSLNTAYDDPYLSRFNPAVRKCFCDNYQTEAYISKLKALLLG